MTRSSPEVERPGAQHWVPAEPTLAALHEAVHDCRGCELYRDATQAVMGRGPAGAGLMLVGEQPGDREDREGEPFVGPAGRVLSEALAAAGVDPEQVYVTNAVKHFRFQWKGKRRIHESPDRGQVAACAPWLAAELEVVRPAGVVLLGGTAGKALYGPGFRVGATRGTPCRNGRRPCRSPSRHPGSSRPSTPRPSCVRGTAARRRTTAWSVTCGQRCPRCRTASGRCCSHRGRPPDRR